MIPLHLSPGIAQYFIEVDAICARPILSDLNDKLTFHYRLYAQWTRNLTALTKRGRAQQFSASEISDILDEINHRIRELKEQIDAQKS
jgi:uncharacterized coiled-coil protein SlyX